MADVFSYIATDSDGDQAGGTLTVSVRDDVATAVADPDTVALRDGEVSPNATLASLIAVAGADGASVTSVNGMELAGSGVLVRGGCVGLTTSCATSIHASPMLWHFAIA